jgi:hypothetical protein
LISIHELIHELQSTGSCHANFGATTPIDAHEICYPRANALTTDQMLTA